MEETPLHLINTIEQNSFSIGQLNNNDSLKAHMLSRACEEKIKYARKKLLALLNDEDVARSIALKIHLY